MEVKNATSELVYGQNTSQFPETTDGETKLPETVKIEDNAIMLKSNDIAQGSNINARKSASKREKKELTSFSELYRYSTKGQKALMILSSLCAAAVGCVFPLFTIIFGQMLDILNDPAQARDASKQADKISALCVYFMIIAAVSSVCSAIENYIPVYVTEHVLARVRHEFMKALLRQDTEWFDTNRGGEATSRLAEGTLQMSSGCPGFARFGSV